MSISTRIAAPHGAVFLVVGAFKSSALFAPHAACTRRLRKPSQLLNPGQRGPNVRATRASGPYPHPLPNGFSRIKLPGARCTRRDANACCTQKLPGAQPDCFQIPRDYVFTM